MEPVGAEQVLGAFDEFVDSVVIGKPEVVVRGQDSVVLMSVSQMRDLLSAYELHIEYDMDEGGRYAGSIKQVEVVVADGQTLEELRHNLAEQLVEYAEDYMHDYQRYVNAPNTTKHAPYVLCVWLEKGVKSVERLLQIN